jgi:hypothetical protein
MTENFRKRGVTFSRKRARFFFLSKPSVKQDISCRAGITDAKAMK